MLAFSLAVVISVLALLTPACALPQAGTTLSLPLARRFNGTGGLTNILARDRARAKALYNRVVNPEAYAEEKRYSSTNVREESPYEFMTYVSSCSRILEEPKYTSLRFLLLGQFWPCPRPCQYVYEPVLRDFVTA